MNGSMRGAGSQKTWVSTSALGEGATGDIAVTFCGDPLDFDLVSLGCQMAKIAKRKVHLLHVIEVPRAFPLHAVLAYESERADKLLKAAMEIADHVGCKAVAEVVQARDAGLALVEEAREHQCALILIGLLRQGNKPQRALDRMVTSVLANAPCRVWLVQDKVK